MVGSGKRPDGEKPHAFENIRPDAKELLSYPSIEVEQLPGVTIKDGQIQIDWEKVEAFKAMRRGDLRDGLFRFWREERPYGGGVERVAIREAPAISSGIRREIDRYEEAERFVYGKGFDDWFNERVGRLSGVMDVEDMQERGYALRDVMRVEAMEPDPFSVLADWLYDVRDADPDISVRELVAYAGKILSANNVDRLRGVDLGEVLTDDMPTEVYDRLDKVASRLAERYWYEEKYPMFVGSLMEIDDPVALLKALEAMYSYSVTDENGYRNARRYVESEKMKYRGAPPQRGKRAELYVTLGREFAPSPLEVLERLIEDLRQRWPELNEYLVIDACFDFSLSKLSDEELQQMAGSKKRFG